MTQPKASMSLHPMTLGPAPIRHLALLVERLKRLPAFWVYRDKFDGSAKGDAE